MRTNLRSPAAWARFLLTCAIGLAVDLVTKAWAFGALLREPVTADDEGRVLVIADTYRFWPGWLHLEAVANQGAVFGLGQGHRWLFLLVSAAAVVMLTYLFLQSGRARLYQVVLGMLLAGVLGNMYDRVQYGYVRDMFHMLPNRQWPDFVADGLSFIPYFRGPLFPWVFNVADSLLCVGVAFSVLYSLRQPQADDAAETARGAEKKAATDGTD